MGRNHTVIQNPKCWYTWAKTGIVVRTIVHNKIHLVNNRGTNEHKTGKCGNMQGAGTHTKTLAPKLVDPHGPIGDSRYRNDKGNTAGAMEH